MGGHGSLQTQLVNAELIGDLRVLLYSILATMTAAIVLLRKRTSSHRSASDIPDEVQARYRSFEQNYLLVYALMVAGDWLQGPYMYALYEYYGFGMGDIGILFIAGFGSSLVFGTFAGSACDRSGRRRGCIGYAVTYVLSCWLKHSSDYNVLMVGRLLGGISTSLLFCAFEAFPRQSRQDRHHSAQHPLRCPTGHTLPERARVCSSRTTVLAVGRRGW